jgi:hypothetical protein
MAKSSFVNFANYQMPTDIVPNRFEQGAHHNPIVRNAQTTQFSHQVLRHLFVVVGARPDVDNEPVWLDPDSQVTHPMAQTAANRLFDRSDIGRRFR